MRGGGELGLFIGHLRRAGGDSGSWFEEFGRRGGVERALARHSVGKGKEMRWGRHVGERGRGGFGRALRQAGSVIGGLRLGCRLGRLAWLAPGPFPFF